LRPIYHLTIANKQNASLEDSFIDEIEDAILMAAESVDKTKFNILIVPFLIEQVIFQLLPRHFFPFAALPSNLFFLFFS